MTLDASLRAGLSLPVVAAPMTAVTGPELVAAACTAGIMGVLPRSNAASADEFARWLEWIRQTVDEFSAQNPGLPIGPLAVNFSSRSALSQVQNELGVCARFGVRVIVNAMGDPGELCAIVHDWGGLLFHDVTTLVHAQKAIDRGVDGVTCIVAGGGGHSGTLNPLVFIPAVRRMFDGTILLAGAVSTGEGVRAAEVLGADLAYLGTRFIASREARVPAAYREQIVASGAADLLYTSDISGLAANWMRLSFEAVGLDPAALPVSAGRGDYRHLPPGVRPWRDIWSAGQGVELIDQILPVVEIVRRLRQDYLKACSVSLFPGADQ
ncbi:MAG: Nitronate monooxygenase [Frankiales bacterium]|nr:Nitronate monooxygenase [Frankiales bacterium]